MFLRKTLLILTIMLLPQTVVAQQSMQGSEVNPAGPVVLQDSVVIPLKWVGGRWIAPFDLINMGNPPKELSGLLSPSKTQGEGTAFIKEEPQPGESDNMADSVIKVDPDTLGDFVEHESVPYIPDYLVIDTEGDFVVALKEVTFMDLNLTGEHPLLVASHFGFSTVIPVEILQIHGAESELEDLTASNSLLLDGGQIVGAVGRSFLETFNATLDQDARILILNRPNFDQTRGQIIKE